MEMANEIKEFAFAIGYFSELILLIIVSVILYLESKLDLVIFLLGGFASGVINRILKKWIKDPRPKDPTKFLDSEHFSKTHPAYGLPSGHSQNIFYTITFFGLITKTFIAWDALFLVIATLMVYERWVFHNHSVIQLATGAALGITFGYGVYWLRDYFVK